MRALLVVYDNDSYIHWFPQGLAYVAAALRNAGHEIVIYNQDQYHYPESRLTDYLTRNRFDAVGIGVIAGYYQYRKLLKLSAAIKAVPNRPFFVLGGHGPAPEPEYFLKKTGADAIVIGEGDITSVELLDALASGRDLSSVNGIAYLDGKRTVVTRPRKLIADLDTIPFPAWGLFPVDYYALLRVTNIQNNERSFPVLSGRGCPFKCNFCYRMDKGFRPRSPESIIEEIQILQKDYRISHILFSDDLLMSSVERVTTLCEAFIKADLKITWTCNGRLNYAKPAVLKLHEKGGLRFY